MKIVCFGDSLALPREGCLYSDTWIAKMKSSFPSVDFVCYFKGGMLIDNILDSWNYMKYVEAETVIVQEGICDCAPRYINDKSFLCKTLINFCNMTKTSSIFWWFVKLGERKSSCTYTSKIIFLNKYNELLNNIYREGVKCVIIIKIGHGAPSVARKSLYFNQNVDAYNQIFEQLKETYGDKLILIDPLNDVDEDMFVDGYHCNAKGMGVVYDELKKVLNNVIA